MTKLIVNITIQGTIETEGEAPLDENFAKELKLRRLTKGLTMVQLAKLSGVSPSHIGRIERGERAPSYSIAVKLKKALGEVKEV